MGDIPVSSVVTVTIGVAPTFPTRAGFGTLNIVGSSNVIGILERSRVYNTIQGVEADFGLDAEEVKAARVYYSQVPSPRQLVISRRVGAPVGAELRGGANAETSLAAWRAVLAGALKVNIGGVAADVTGLVFSNVNTLPAVASIVQAGIRAVADATSAYTAAVVTYKNGRFYLTSGETGPTSVIGLATAPATGTDISGMLNWTFETNARTTNGSAEETPVQALAAAQDVNQDWYGIGFTKEVRDNESLLEAAAWAQARVKMLGFDTEDRENLDPANEGSLAYQLDQGAYSRTLGAFNDTAGEYAAISALARLFTTNYNVANSALTLKFKQMPTITPADLRASEKAALDKIHLNAYYDVGGNPMFGEGWMFGGRFADEVHGLDWLQNAVETNVFGKLYTDPTKTEMTDSGVASLQQQVEKALDQGVNNGLLAPGYLPDGTYLAKGYATSAVKVRDHNQSDKEARQGPPISFTAIGAGAIHGITIVGNFQR